METNLAEKARQIRKDVLAMVLEAGSGHLGGSFSATDILVALYYHQMRLFPDPNDPRRDRFVLSKGHAVPALYAILADKGYVDKKELHRLRRLGSLFQGHPDTAKCPGLDCTTGSLGQGLSVAGGLAYGLRYQHADAKVYVLTGDGELDEGICWEAFMSSANFKLDNLTIIIDRNGLQLSKPTEELMKLENLHAKLEAFGLAVDEIDGHDFEAIVSALDKQYEGKPHVIIAHTVKGKGVSFMEHEVAWHGGIPKGEQIDRAYAELGGRMNG